MATKIKIISATVVQSEQVDNNGNHFYDVILSIRAMNNPQKRYSFRVFGCTSEEEAKDTADYYKTAEDACEEMGFAVVPVDNYLHKNDEDKWTRGKIHILISNVIEGWSQQERLAYLVENGFIKKSKKKVEETSQADDDDDDYDDDEE